MRARRVLPTALVGLLLVGAALLGAWRSARAPEPSAVAITSTGTVFSSVDALTDAADVVVIARAVAVSPGRTFAASGGDGIRSQIVRLEVGAVLAGGNPGPTIALEEEATTATGEPVVVDGLRPTRVGDQGIFFLERSREEGVPYYATLGSAGRYLRRSARTGDDALFTTTTDPLAGRLAALGGSRLADAVVARARETGRPVGPLPS